VESQIRPVVNEVIVAYSMAHCLFFVIVLGLMLVLPVPWFVLLPAVILLTVVDLIAFALRALGTFWVRLTQRYAIDTDGGYVRMQREWASRTSELVPFRNISEVRAAMPLFLGMFGVGHVVIDTNDGKAHILYNVKDPRGIIERIRPAPGEPVFRPSVG